MLAERLRPLDEALAAVREVETAASRALGAANGEALRRESTLGARAVETARRRADLEALTAADHRRDGGGRSDNPFRQPYHADARRRAGRGERPGRAPDDASAPDRPAEPRGGRGVGDRVGPLEDPHRRAQRCRERRAVAAQRAGRTRPHDVRALRRHLRACRGRVLGLVHRSLRRRFGEAGPGRGGRGGRGWRGDRSRSRRAKNCKPSRSSPAANER